MVIFFSTRKGEAGQFGLQLSGGSLSDKLLFTRSITRAGRGSSSHGSNAGMRRLEMLGLIKAFDRFTDRIVLWTSRSLCRPCPGGRQGKETHAYELLIETFDPRDSGRIVA